MPLEIPEDDERHEVEVLTPYEKLKRTLDRVLRRDER